MKPTHYSSADYNTVESLFDMLKGLGLLSFGGGLAYGGLKGYRKRFFEASAPELLQPSKFVRNRMKDKQIPIDPQYLSSDDEDDDLEKRSSYLVHKFCKYAAGDEGWLEWLARAIGRKAHQVGEAASSGFRSAEEPLLSKADRNWYEYVEQYRPLSNSDIRALDRKGVTLHSLDSARERGGWHRIKAELAARPGLRSAWFLPAATAVGLGGARLGYTTSQFIEKSLGKSKSKLPYNGDAQKIYEQSAKYLKDVAEGKDVNDPVKKKKKRKDEDMQKESDAKEYKPPYDKIVSGDGSSTFWGWSSLLGIPAAFFVARQLGNFNSGLSDVKDELADRTHMIRAWQAAAKERQYDYNDLASEIAPEPVDDDTARRIINRQQNVEDNITDDDNANQLRYENFIFNEIRDDQNKLT